MECAAPNDVSVAPFRPRSGLLVFRSSGKMNRPNREASPRSSWAVALFDRHDRSAPRRGRRPVLQTANRASCLGTADAPAEHTAGAEVSTQPAGSDKNRSSIGRARDVASGDHRSGGARQGQRGSNPNRKVPPPAAPPSSAVSQVVKEITLGAYIIPDTMYGGRVANPDKEDDPAFTWDDAMPLRLTASTDQSSHHGQPDLR